MKIRNTLLKHICITLLSALIVAQAAQAATLHGFVRDKSNKEPIIMANVWLQDTRIGATTNMKGHYTLAGLNAGTYTACFRYVGYKMQTTQITLRAEDDLTLDALLESQEIVLQQTVVTAERDKSESEIKPSQISVDAPQLRSIPQVAEADLFRAVQMLPGVATLSDFSAGLYVRGGSPDQNLILLDQIDVYNPNHMFGFFSTFNTDAIKSVELLKGGFPSAYGGRLSSVLNVYNKEGNRESFQGVARLSLLSASTTLEGPWKKGSWMVSGRRTYLELASKMADFDLPYYFYDAHARFNYDLDSKNQIAVSFYLGNDLLDLSQDGTSIKLDWGNKTFSSQWTHLFSSKVFSHFVFAGSRFDSQAKIKFDRVGFGTLNKITDLSLKGMLSYVPNASHAVDFGFESKKLGFALDYSIIDTEYRNPFDGYYLACYMQDNYRLNLFNTLQAGVRFEHYSDGNYSRLTPQISLKHIFTDHTHMTLSYGRYHQFLNQVQQDGMSFADMWFPIDKSFQPGQADHYIMGYTYDNNESFSIDVEGYYKRYRNIAEYRTYRGADEELSHQNASQIFLSGSGQAYGGDIFLRNNWAGFEGWIGYSLCWTTKQVNGFNFNEQYYPTYDRRHTFTLIQDHHLGRKWRLNLAFKYASGQPYTEATARYLASDPAGRSDFKALDGKKNFYRLPDYHRLDLGLFRDMHIFGLPAEFFIQAVNVYNHKNVWYRQYQLQYNPARVKDYTQIPFIPTAGLSVRF